MIASCFRRSHSTRRSARRFTAGEQKCAEKAGLADAVFCGVLMSIEAINFVKQFERNNSQVLTARRGCEPRKEIVTQVTAHPIPHL